MNAQGLDAKNFYEKWSSKESILIMHDIRAGKRKAEQLIQFIQKNLPDIRFKNMIDYGCGFGSVLTTLQDKRIIVKGLGFDCSEHAIKIASSSKNDGLNFFCLPQLEISNNIQFVKDTTKRELGVDKVDGIILFDLLEHVPDCIDLIERLSEVTDTFIIKLPLEKSILDNYVLNKPYPGSGHYNGHLREFDVNNVRYFIRTLGLVPIIESHYKYDIRDAFPPQCFRAKDWERAIKFNLLKVFKYTMSLLLPNKWFLRLIGGGFYICVAKFDRKLLLRP